ncbi:MAG: hypothetical protein KJ072_15650 [Verrucomicrobia bacterium]|nr:hypothetical protein [Verrucomicrobiota bacterium]
MTDKPKVDPYPEPVAMTAINLRRINRMQAEKGRADRLQRLSRRNRDVAWLLGENQRLTKPVPKKVAAK